MKSAGGVTYAYDGSGRRVSKSSGKLYWYGSGGEILAETNAAGATLNEYIFFGGKRVAMLPAGGNPEYYAEDLLGSSRVTTQNNGTVCYDADFYPYGGERAYTNSCSSANAYKFEGKERDTETGNDDFGARYYSNRFGRWLSADWSNVPVPVPYANLTNPQTLNLYAMVSDDPESFADLDGHIQNASQGLAAPEGINPGTGELLPDGLSCASQPESCESAAAQQQQTNQVNQQNQQQAQSQRMSLSAQGLDFIKGYEKLRLNVYKDQAGYETIGYGHKVLPGENFASGITKAQALDLLKQDVQSAVGAVNAALKVSVKQNQFDALVSLAFNAGGAAVLGRNQMMRAVNSGSVAEANFTTYRYIHVNGKAVVSQGLLNRRQAEYKMFSGGTP